MWDEYLYVEYVVYDTECEGNNLIQFEIVGLEGVSEMRLGNDRQ